MRRQHCALRWSSRASMKRRSPPATDMPRSTASTSPCRRRPHANSSRRPASRQCSSVVAPKCSTSAARLDSAPPRRRSHSSNAAVAALGPDATDLRRTRRRITSPGGPVIADARTCPTEFCCAATTIIGSMTTGGASPSETAGAGSSHHRTSTQGSDREPETSGQGISACDPSVHGSVHRAS